MAEKEVVDKQVVDKQVEANGAQPQEVQQEVKPKRISAELLKLLNFQIRARQLADAKAKEAAIEIERQEQILNRCSEEIRNMEVAGSELLRYLYAFHQVDSSKYQLNSGSGEFEERLPKA